VTIEEWTRAYSEAQEHLAQLQRAGAPARERRDAGLAVGRLKRLRPPGAHPNPAAAEDEKFWAACEHLDRAVQLFDCETWHELARLVLELPDWVPDAPDDVDNVVSFRPPEEPQA
jgi:hypothetical protein